MAWKWGKQNKFKMTVTKLSFIIQCQKVMQW